MTRTFKRGDTISVYRTADNGLPHPQMDLIAASNGETGRATVIDAVDPQTRNRYTVCCQQVYIVRAKTD